MAGLRSGQDFGGAQNRALFVCVRRWPGGKQGDFADGGTAALQELKPVLEACSEWTAGVLEAAVKAHAEKIGIKLGRLAQPLRAALTGTSTSPPIFDVLDVLGREEAIGRINDLLN